MSRKKLNYFLNSLGESVLVEYKFPQILSLIPNKKIYTYKCCDSSKPHLKRWLKHYKTESLKKTIIIFDNKDETIHFLLFDWKGLFEVIDYLCEIVKISENKKRLTKFQIKNMLSRIDTDISEICKNYSVIIHDDKIDIIEKIVPNKAVDGDKFIILPKSKYITINKISVHFGISGKISSVKLDSKHPNCDSDGWFCLGSMRYEKLNLKNCDKLIEQIKIYKLDDCYWKPN